MTVQDFRRSYEKRETEKEMVMSSITTMGSEIERLNKDKEIAVKAKWVLQEVAKNTQQILSERIESLVTMAMQAVYERPFIFHVTFDTSGNKSECVLAIEENGEIYENVSEDMGIGLLDVVSFALRVVLWSMEKPRSRNTIILDEPFKFVGHGELLDRTGVMIKTIQERLGIQFIIVTHERGLEGIADKVWEVKLAEGKSMVALMKGEEEKMAEELPKKGKLHRRK